MAWDGHAQKVCDYDLPVASYLDSVPFSGIIRIRDMMYTVDRPFRLDQGDVSFDAPESVKRAQINAVEDNRTHSLVLQRAAAGQLVDTKY